MEGLAEKAANVSRRLSEHGIAANVNVARYQNGHMAVQFEVQADFLVALGEMLAERLDDLKGAASGE